MRLGFFFSFFLCLDITISGKDFNQFFPPKMPFCIGKVELGTFFFHPSFCGQLNCQLKAMPQHTESICGPLGFVSFGDVVKHRISKAVLHKYLTSHLL